MKSLLRLTVLFLATVSSYAQEPAVKVETRPVAIPVTSVQPLSGFSLSTSIETRLKLADGPVKIVGLGDGLFMSTVEVKNVSAKEVKAIKLNWYLFSDPNSTREAKKGQTKLINLGRLGISDSKTVESQIPEFDKMFAGLAKDGYIGGKYFLDATVGEVEYLDGTKWTREASPLPDKSSNQRPSLLTFADLQRNEGVEGSFRIEGHVIDTYKCPPCPPGAMCKPCIPDNIVITDDIEQKEPSKINRLRIYYNKPEQFEVNKKYSFTVRVKGKVPAGQAIHDADLISFEPVKP